MGPTPPQDVAEGGPRPAHVWGPRGSAAAALSPIYSSRCENPKHPSHYPQKVSEAPPSSTLAREGPEPLPDTLSERGIVTGGFYIAMPASGVTGVQTCALPIWVRVGPSGLSSHRPFAYLFPPMQKL